MNKAKIFILSTLFLILFSFNVFAALNDSNVLYYSFDDVDLTGSNPNDLSINSNNGTNNGATTGATGILNEAFDFDNTNDYVDADAFTIGIDFTVSLWYYADTYNPDTYYPRLWQNYDGTTGHNMVVENSNTLIWGPDTGSGVGTAVPSTGAWHHIVALKNSTGYFLYVNGIKPSQSADAPGNPGPDVTAFRIGASGTSAIHGVWDGKIDEVSIWNRALTSTEITELYNNNTANNFYDVAETPATAIYNHSVEKLLQISRNDNVTINSNTYTTIYTADYDFTQNTTGYITSSIQSISNNDFTQYCRTLIDGIDYDTEQSRSMTADQLGNSYLMSSTFNLLGLKTIELQCRTDSNPASYLTIDHATSVIHLLYDDQNDVINHQSFNQNFTLTDTYQVLMNYTFNMSNKTVGNLTRKLIMDGKVSYNFINAGNISIYAVIDGTSSPVHIRYGDTSTTGSGGGFLISENISSSSVDVLLYGKSTSNDGSVNILGTIKEHIAESYDANQVNFSGSVINSTSFITIKNLSLNGPNTQTGNYLIQAAISTLSNTDTSTTYRLKYDNIYSEEFARNYVTDKAGIVVLQHVFNITPSDNINIELQGYTTSGNNVIVGGSFIGYSVNEEAIDQTLVGVRLKRSWDNTDLTDFSVSTSTGLTVSTLTGVASLPATDEVVNLTISSDGYLDEIILNHNISLSLNSTIDHTRTTFNIYEILTGNKINNFSINGSFYYYNTTNGSITLPLLADEAVTINFYNDLGYYNLTQNFTVSPASTSIQNFSVYNTLINFSARDVMTDTLLNDFNIILNYEGNITENYISGTSDFVPGIIGIDLNSTFNKTGYALFIVDHNFNSSIEQYEHLVYTTNSLNITYYNAETGSLLTGVSITTQFIGTTAQTNVTSTGSLFVDLLSPDWYTILSDASGYRQNKYEILVVNKSFTNLRLYLQPENTSNLVLLTVTDRFGKELQDVQIIIQKWFNDAWVTEQIVSTDFNGQAEAYYILSDVYYNHILKYNDQVEFGAINDDQNKKIIYAEDVTNGIKFNIDILEQESLNNFLTVYQDITNLSFSNSSNTTASFRFFFSTYDARQVTGAIKVYNLDTNTIVCETSTVTSTGTIFCNINTNSSNLYRAVGFISDIPISEYIIRFGPTKTINFGTLGYFIAVFILIIAYFMFINVPTLAIWTGSLSLIVLSMLGIVFQDMNFIAFIAILALTYLVANIKSESGVNA